MKRTKLMIEKFELLKAMNFIVRMMNDQGAYIDWIFTIPDEASEDELLDIALDEDEEVFREACELFREICHEYIDAGFFLGAFPGPSALYGENKEERQEGLRVPATFEQRVVKLRKKAIEEGKLAAAGYDEGWANGAEDAYANVLELLREGAKND